MTYTKHVERRVWLLVIIVLSLSPVRAQVVLNSIDEAWQYADKHNIQIETSLIAGQQAKATKQQAYSTLLPQVNANGQFTNNWALSTTLLPGELVGKPGTYVPVKFGQQYVYVGALTAQMDIVNVANWFNVRMAEANARLAQAQTAESRKTIYEQVALQFYTSVLLNAAADLARKNFNLADSLYQSSRDKFNNGLISEPALNSTYINQLKAVQNLSDARVQAREQINVFKQLLNLGLNDSIILSNAITAKDTVINDFKSMTDDPALHIAASQYNVAQEGLHNAEYQLLPVLSLQGNIGYQQNSNDFKPFDKSVNWYPNKYYGLKVTWPLFTGGSHLLQWQKNKEQLLQTKLQYDYTKKQSELDDNTLQLDYEKYRSDRMQSEKILALYLQNFYHRKYLYNDGLASLDDVSLALTDYVNYQNTYLNTLANYYITIYKVKIRQKLF